MRHGLVCRVSGSLIEAWLVEVECVMITPTVAAGNGELGIVCDRHCGSVIFDLLPFVFELQWGSHSYPLDWPCDKSLRVISI
jgi:hypothetical protein